MFKNLGFGGDVMHARNELEEILSGLPNKIICAKIIYDDYKLPAKEIILREEYTLEEYDLFFNQLDFEYDDGYGLQHLYGLIWLDRGKWLEREEYDGSEWWAIREYPKIPKELKQSK